MSRHIVDDGRFEFVFGWDQMLMTFYLQKHDPSIPEEDDQIVVWLPLPSDRRLYEVEDLVREARKNGLNIDSVMQTRLYADKDDGV